MKQSMEEFQNLASRYRDLYRASFDADSATLRNVELYPLSFGRPCSWDVFSQIQSKFAQSKIQICYSLCLLQVISNFFLRNSIGAHSFTLKFNLFKRAGFLVVQSTLGRSTTALSRAQGSDTSLLSPVLRRLRISWARR